MSKHENSDGYEERMEQGSDIVFNMLGGEYIDPETGMFKSGHEERVAVAKHALNLLGMPQEEIEEAVDYGEACVLDHIEQLKRIERIEILERMGLRGN